MRASLFSLPLLLTACAGGETAPPPNEKPPEAACDLALDKLADKVFVLNGVDGKADTSARVKFFADGDKLKAKYNSKSLINLYDYTCAPNKDELTCWEDSPSATKWCNALIANDKECSADEVAKLTGLDVAKITEEVNTARAAALKLKGAEAEQFRTLYNSPNTPLRGVLHVKVKKKGCALSFADQYMTMSFGQIREMENLVGKAEFVSSDAPLSFEACTVAEGQALVALTAPDAKAAIGEHKRDWAVGAPIPMAYVGPNHVKAEPGCTYAMDLYASGVQVGTHQSVAAAEDGTLRWAFTHTFDKAGPSAFHVARYRTCEGKPEEKVDVLCQAVSVQ